jgi:nicotinic acid mononucleotide adenylyltransferase
MCELAAAPLGPRARVSRAEAELAARPGFVASRTLDLVEHIAASGHAPRLVVGSDILGEIAKWFRWDDVVARAPLIVIGRGGRPPPSGYAATEVTMPEISATRVRELVASGSSDVTGLVPRDVLRYIAQHRLYQP